MDCSNYEHIQPMKIETKLEEVLNVPFELMVLPMVDREILVPSLLQARVRMKLLGLLTRPESGLIYQELHHNPRLPSHYYWVARVAYTSPEKYALQVFDMTRFNRLSLVVTPEVEETMGFFPDHLGITCFTHAA